jgi:hypothetical protein
LHHCPRARANQLSSGAGIRRPVACSWARSEGIYINGTDDWTGPKKATEKNDQAQGTGAKGDFGSFKVEDGKACLENEITGQVDSLDSSSLGTAAGVFKPIAADPASGDTVTEDAAKTSAASHPEAGGLAPPEINTSGNLDEGDAK